jgi:argininosuccinate lyase
VKNRATIGGPQPAEMDRMLKEARAQLSDQGKWIKARRDHIDQSLADLDKAFAALAASATK